MKFFNLDCHVSVIADIKKILESLGHEVVSYSISGHNWVFNRTPTKVDIINPTNWRQLDSAMCDSFYERYKNELSEYDGFICTYPLTFSLLYEKFKKPIILHIPIRYETPFESKPEQWEKFNSFLTDGIDNKTIFPISNSLYDKEYFEHFINRSCDYIPNICDYTETTWEPKREEFLYYSRLPINDKSNLLFDKSRLGKYQWSDITKFKGIVMIPYNCSTMSIFEFYTSNIPLFCPSINFMCELYSKYGDYVLSELTWNRIFNLGSGSKLNNNKINDPNKYDDITIMSEWIKLSDFYNAEWMPYITYFDSFEDLFIKLKTVNLDKISNQMKTFNITRKKSIINKWKNKLLEIYG